MTRCIVPQNIHPQRLDALAMPDVEDVPNKGKLLENIRKKIYAQREIWMDIE